MPMVMWNTKVLIKLWDLRPIIFGQALGVSQLKTPNGVPSTAVINLLITR